MKVGSSIHTTRLRTGLQYWNMPKLTERESAQSGEFEEKKLGQKTHFK